MDTNNEEDCKCIKVGGHLEAVKWLLWRRKYYRSPGYLALGEWTKDPYIWLHYVESNDGLLPDDDVLLTTDTRYWSIHDVQRYFIGELHCEVVLFTYQYPNLKMPTCLGRHLWKANTALKSQPKTYVKELNMSIEHTLKKIEFSEAQLDRLIIADQLINIYRLDCFKRRTFFRVLLNVLSFQDRLQLVSFENLLCNRLEGVRLIQQLACFNANTVKYLFLWRFVLPNENPILVNYSYITATNIRESMTTDEEKNKLSKLLQDLEVKEMKLPERCNDLIKDIRQKFSKDVEDDEPFYEQNKIYENPYRVDPRLLEENEKKLRELLSKNKSSKKEHNIIEKVLPSESNKPWRTNSNKEKLIRINCELKRHMEKGTEMIMPLSDEELNDLIEECTENNKAISLATASKLRDAVDAARKDLPNFQYRNIDNSTATEILREIQS